MYYIWLYHRLPLHIIMKTNFFPLAISNGCKRWKLAYENTLENEIGDVNVTSLAKMRKANEKNIGINI